MGVFAAERGDVFGLRRWYMITFLMGLFFVLGQAYEYIHLVQTGTTIGSSNLSPHLHCLLQRHECHCCCFRRNTSMA